MSLSGTIILLRLLLFKLDADKPIIYEILIDQVKVLFFFINNWVIDVVDGYEHSFYSCFN